MPREFGDWMNSMAGSIEDASTVKREEMSQQPDVDFVKQLRQRAFKYAKLNVSSVDDVSDVVNFIAIYRDYLAGLEMMDKMNNINPFHTNYNGQMMKFWEEFKNWLEVK